jgi:hypothetical protein
MGTYFVGTAAVLTNTLFIPRSKLSGFSSNVASARELSGPFSDATETTGVCEPDIRIRLVSRSLSFAGRDLSRSTRSKSPSRNLLAASLSESTDTTMYPADCRSDFRIPSDNESNPTASTSVSGMYDLRFQYSITAGLLLTSQPFRASSYGGLIQVAACLPPQIRDRHCTKVTSAAQKRQSGF